MLTTFSKLDKSHKEFIVMNISVVLLYQMNRWFQSEEILRIFDCFDVDVEVSEDETYQIRNNEKLKLAVARITEVPE